MGRRRKKEGRKDFTFHMRLDHDTLEKLDLTSKSLDMTKSDIVRYGIERLWEESQICDEELIQREETT